MTRNGIIVGLCVWLAAAGVGLADEAKQPGFDLLRVLGLTRKQIKALNTIVCGTQTVEGAPEPRQIWQAVHKDLRDSARIRAVLDFIGKTMTPVQERVTAA